MIDKIINYVSNINKNTYILVVDDRGIGYYKDAYPQNSVNQATQLMTDKNNNKYRIVTVKQISRKEAKYQYCGSQFSALITPTCLNDDLRLFLETKVRRAVEDTTVLMTFIY